jgi:hypothetical protein
MDKAQATAVRTLTGALLLLLWATVSGCATTTAPATWQPGNAQPLITGWQRYFEIQWEVARQDRDALIEGYITNTWGFGVREVRVLVNGYDSSGTQIGQLVAWGPNAIEPGERAYFDVTILGAAATYDVSTFSWRWTRLPSSGPGRHDGESWATRREGDRRSPPAPLTWSLPALSPRRWPPG